MWGNVIMTISEAVARRITDLLIERKMTQYRLEQKSGVLHGSLACIMNGKTKSIQLDTIIKIARGFNMSFIEFLNHPLFTSEDLEIE